MGVGMLLLAGLLLGVEPPPPDDVAAVNGHTLEIPVKFEIFTYKDPELCAATDY